MLESFILAGVPVLSLPMGNLRSYNFFERGIEVSSPTRPPEIFSPPLNIIPFKKVPVVKMVLVEIIFSPLLSSTPWMVFSLTKMSTTSPSLIVISVSDRIC